MITNDDVRVRIVKDGQPPEHTFDCTGLAIDNAGVDHSVELELSECGIAGCPGCNWAHYVPTGRQFVHVTIEGHTFKAEIVAGTAKWDEDDA